MKELLSGNEALVRGALEAGIEIACGDGRTLRILELQPQNGKRMAVASYLAGHPVQVTV